MWFTWIFHFFLLFYNYCFVIILLSIPLRLSQNTGSSIAGSGKALEGATAKERVQKLSALFYRTVTQRVLRSLKFEDKLMFMARLAQISTAGEPEKRLTQAEETSYRRVLGLGAEEASEELLQKCRDAIPGRSLEESCARRLLPLVSLPALSTVFGALLDSMRSAETSAAWASFMDCAEAEKTLPANWLGVTGGSPPMSSVRKALLRIRLMQALRPDRVTQAVDMFVSEVFGAEFVWRDESDASLQDIIATDTTSRSPVMLCAEAGQGQDVSGKIDQIAGCLNKTLLQVSMGSAEGFVQAEKAISQAAKSGHWVLLRNTHLCTDWLGKLEKKLVSLTLSESFRLFLTSEIVPTIPSSLLRMSDVIFVEASSGVKASLHKFFSGIPAARVDRSPAERSRLYSLLAWFNAIVQERLRYVPLGWTRKYEFSEADAACSLDVIDQWVDSVSAGGTKAHVNPKDLPWKALRVLLSQSLYGGRIDNVFDQAALDSFIEQIFSPRSYESGAAIAFDYSAIADGASTQPKTLLALPDGFTRQAFEQWIRSVSLFIESSVAYIHTYTHTRVHTHTYTHTHSHIYTRTHTLLLLSYPPRQQRPPRQCFTSSTGFTCDCRGAAAVIARPANTVQLGYCTGTP